MRATGETRSFKLHLASLTTDGPAGRLAVAKLGAVPRGEVEVRADAGFRVEDAGVRLVDRDQVLGRAEAGEARGDLGRRQLLVWQPVLAGAGQRAADEVALRSP